MIPPTARERSIVEQNRPDGERHLIDVDVAATPNRIFLFSVDLEDVRFEVQNGQQYRERVPDNTHAYLDWLARRRFSCTFFTVGNVAERYPSLIAEIVSAGHEIACHTNTHLSLDRQTPASFREDLERNMDHLRRAGVPEMDGFRAPTFSLTEHTKWAYDVLGDLGFTYSSSVLPARNPLFGWEGFGSAPRRVSAGLLEIPMTVGRVGPVTVPYGGGVYFRNLPRFLIRAKARRHVTSDNPLLGYFHPYDVDTEQEHFMHPSLNNNRILNELMYINRGSVFSRLDMLIDAGFRVCTFRDYVVTHAGSLP